MCKWITVCLGSLVSLGWPENVLGPSWGGLLASPCFLFSSSVLWILDVWAPRPLVTQPSSCLDSKLKISVPRTVPVGSDGWAATLPQRHLSFEDLEKGNT